jgi:predicted nucleotidyltransferase component of viral defense system
MLNTQEHEIAMKRLLLDIFSNPKLKTELAFKGGTCLYFFHKLNRFSTDLDFNLISNDLSANEIEKIINTAKLEIVDSMNKSNTWFWAVSYGKNTVKIKIEISKRDYPDTYEIIDYLGIKLKIMSKDCMFAHKLCAISDRKTMQNRDLFDALFMFKNNYSINPEIIKLRTGKDTKAYFAFLIDYIKANVNSNKILDGLGEVLDPSLKSYYKKNLLPDLILELGLRI